MPFFLDRLLHPDLDVEFSVFHFGHALYFRFPPPHEQFSFWINIDASDSEQRVIELRDEQKEALYAYGESLQLEKSTSAI